MEEETEGGIQEWEEVCRKGFEKRSCVFMTLALRKTNMAERF